MVHLQRVSPLAQLHQAMLLAEVLLQRAVAQVRLLLLQLQLLVQLPALHRVAPLVPATDAI
jgi:hypothetical protein